jgi:hypothetical protein
MIVRKRGEHVAVVVVSRMKERMRKEGGQERREHKRKMARGKTHLIHQCN